MKRLSAIVILLVLAVAAPRAHGQTTSATGVYSAGWNMAGGPAGTDFSRAAYLYAWQNGTYVAQSSKVATGCGGYWAYFNTATTVPLAAPSGATSVTCPLQFGWNVVGNPFAVRAILPAGVTAYHWNPQRGDYDVVSTLNPGDAVWIYSPAPGTITLTTTPATATAVPATPVPPTLVIDAFAGAGPYTIHVGDSIRVIVPSIVPSTVSADSNYLTLEGAGVQYELTCIGDPLCQTNPTVQFWTYRSVAAGSTSIAVTPRCGSQAPPCLEPSRLIQLSILP